MLVADGFQIKAHQIILAASSTYFENTFATTNQKCPGKKCVGKIPGIFLLNFITFSHCSARHSEKFSYDDLGADLYWEN